VKLHTNVERFLGSLDTNNLDPTTTTTTGRQAAGQWQCSVANSRKYIQNEEGVAL
jgi:hypothetical protein